MKKFLVVSLLALTTTITHAKLDQSFIIGTSLFVSMIKLPQELLWSLSKPFRNHQYNKKKETALALMSRKMEDLSCEQKCFDDFRVLKNARQRTFPESGEDLLSFLNEKSDFADYYQRTVGYCWGHSSVTRNFAYLSFYDPEQKLEKAPSEENEKDFVRFYNHKIKKIMRGRAQIIPGFKNTREFSTHPLLKMLFKKQVAWKWADKALRVGSIHVSFRGKKGLMEAPAVNELMADIKDKLSYNHVPKIFFTNLKKTGFIHVVNVYDVREDEQSYKLCILDNHMYEDVLKDCGAFVSVKKDGSENYFPGWDDPKRGLEGYVGQIGYTPEDSREILRFQKENKKMCERLCKKESVSDSNDNDEESSDD